MENSERINKTAICAQEILSVFEKHDPPIAMSAIMDVMIAFVVTVTGDREDLAWEGLGVLEKDLRNKFVYQLETMKKIMNNLQ